MEHFIVDMQTEKSKKYYFIREEVSQEIVLLPSQYLMHKMRAKGSPNTIKRSALVISYYLNYLSENQLTMEDVWNMKYEKQQEHFTDFLIWLKAGMHSKDEYTKKPYNETCNAYLKEVFRLYNFAEQQEGCEQSIGGYCGYTGASTVKSGQPGRIYAVIESCKVRRDCIEPKTQAGIRNHEGKR